MLIRKLDAYYEVARQLLEKEERDTRPVTPAFGSPEFNQLPDAGSQPFLNWWMPSTITPVATFVREYRRTGCRSDIADCSNNEMAVALMQDFVLKQMLLQSEPVITQQSPIHAYTHQTIPEPPLFTIEQEDMLQELEKGPFALNDPYLGVLPRRL